MQKGDRVILKFRNQMEKLKLPEQYPLKMVPTEIINHDPSIPILFFTFYIIVIVLVIGGKYIENFNRFPQ